VIRIHFDKDNPTELLVAGYRSLVLVAATTNDNNPGTSNWCYVNRNNNAHRFGTENTETQREINKIIQCLCVFSGDKIQLT
jgi:hypothetical protein